MKKILAGWVGLVFAAILAATTVTPVYALDQETCRSIISPSFAVSGFPVTLAGDNGTPTVYDRHPYGPAAVRFSGFVPNQAVSIECRTDGDVRASTSLTANAQGVATWELSDSACMSKYSDAVKYENRTVNGHFRVTVTNSGGGQTSCVAGPYEVRPEAQGIRCTVSAINETTTGLAGCFQPNDVVSFTANFSYVTGAPYDRSLFYRVTNIAGGGVGAANVFTPTNGSHSSRGTVVAAGSPINITYYRQNAGFLNAPDAIAVCQYQSPTPVVAVCTPEQRLATPRPSGGEDLSNFSLCRQIPILTAADIQRQVNNAREEDKARLQTELQRRARDQQGEKRRCCLCTTGNGQIDSTTGACAAERDANVRQRQGFKPGIYTAVGCIGADSESIVTSLVRIGLGIAGGIALLMILAGAFLFTTSQGDPKQASQAKELITSAIMGLLFVIFSVTILQFIGVTILQIPGFGSTGP